MVDDPRCADPCRDECHVGLGDQRAGEFCRRIGHRASAEGSGCRDASPGEDGSFGTDEERRDLGAADVDPDQTGAVGEDDAVDGHGGALFLTDHAQRPPSPAIAMPLTRCFCNTITRIVVGTIEMMAAAICRSHRVPVSPAKLASPTGRVPCAL